MFGVSLALQSAEGEVSVTVPSPNHFLLENLLLELGKKCHHHLCFSTVGRGRISDGETGRGQEGDGVGHWHTRGS